MNQGHLNSFPLATQQNAFTLTLLRNYSKLILQTNIIIFTIYCYFIQPRYEPYYVVLPLLGTRCR